MKLFQEFPSSDKAQWTQQALKDLKGKDFDQMLLWHTHEGFTIQPYYTQEDLNNLQPIDSQTTNGWENWGTVIFTNEKETQAKLIQALQTGADALLIDLSAADVTQIHLSKLLDKIKLSDTPVYFKVNNQAVELLEGLAQFIHYQMKGGIYDDALARLMTTGFWDDTFWQNLSQTITKTYNSPHFRVMTVQSHHFHNAGATAVQELAFTLASVVTYFDKLMTDQPDSWKVQELAENLCVSLSVGTNYFMEIAKIRAWKYLYGQVLAAYQVQTTYDISPFVHAQTSAYYQAALTPYTNMLRASTEAMSAILGGCNALSTRAYKADIEEDTDDFGQRIAQNVSTILKEESYLDKTTDPAAGSYYLETLSHTLATEAWALFQEVEAQGGIIEAFKNGFVQKQLNASHQRKVEALQNNLQTMVGVNKFRFDEEPFQTPPETILPNIATDVELLKEVRLSEVIERGVV